MPNNLTAHKRSFQVTQTLMMDDYLELLTKSETEPQALMQDLLISVTSFFRDLTAFEALTSVARPESLAQVKGLRRRPDCPGRRVV
jgi:chemotaxis methyl-accepting protein methylase